MDKMLALIIIFLGISFSLAAVLAMGAVPKIFQTQETTQNQTEIILKYFDRQNNTTQKILNILHEADIKKLQILENQNRSLTNQKIMLEQQANQSSETLNISREHKQVAKDHDIISNTMKNVTDHIDKSLYEYGENSVKQLQKIIDRQDNLNQTLQTLLEKTK